MICSVSVSALQGRRKKNQPKLLLVSKYKVRIRLSELIGTAASVQISYNICATQMVSPALNLVLLGGDLKI
jgi:hypothetical protein